MNEMRLFIKKFYKTIIIFILLVSNSLANNASSIYSTEDYSLADLNYITLENKLPIYEYAVSHPWASISPKSLLKPGITSPAILALRYRLRATNDLKKENDTGSPLFDAKLVTAVKFFQSTHGLNPDGIIGSSTIYELNIPPEQRLMQIRVNMKRWYRLSEKFGARFILINIPAYRLDLIENGKKIMSMRAVVGKPERQTPEIISTITRLVLNPYWNVPKSIARRDIIPKIIANPDYLNMTNMKIIDRQESNPTEIYPDEINWDRVKNEGFPYSLRQDPGEQNALGLVKFEFQNSDNIYMHDTPSKNLFNRDKRAFSSGCIRLERPFDLADYLMEEDPKWNEDMVYETLNEGKTKYIKVSKPTKVVITYLTTWVDDNGNLQFRDDLYGLDENIQAIY
ncbi:L,D-transpeptidase family protein [Gammaproteobacteria bacterium]|nr:L,D-transpeptidase family protein [Gammaproteobacteria bacterium]